MKRWGPPGLWRATLRSRTALEWVLSKLGLNDDGMKEDLTIRDEVARAAAGVLATHANSGEAKRASLKPPATWQAYDHYLRADTAWAMFQASWKLEDLLETRRHLADSLKNDQKYARAHSLLASTHRVAWLNPLNDEYLNPSALDHAITLAYTAVELDPNLPEAYAELGYTIIRKRNFDTAAAAAQKALALNPEFADYRVAQVLFSVGEPAKAIEVAKGQMQRDPSHPHFAPLIAGEACYLMKQYREARRWLREATRRAPDHQYGHAFLAATYAQLRQSADAHMEAAKVLQLNPNYTIGKQKQVSILRRQEDVDHFVDGLRMAGLPE
jgi:adenylate cyclase